MVAHFTGIHVRGRQEHAKFHAVMPLCMALTTNLSSCRKAYNILIQRTLELNLMPFDDDPTSFTLVGNEADRVVVASMRPLT
jgi:hypothetical protein